MNNNPQNRKTSVYLKKLVIIALILIIVILIFQAIRVLSFDNTRNFTLGGTYTCEELPFSIMSFEIDGSNKFTYYYGNEQLVDNGDFNKDSDGIYTLNSSMFKSQELICYKKFPTENGFTIKIDGVDCKFVQVNSIPSQISKSIDSNGAPE